MESNISSENYFSKYKVIFILFLYLLLMSFLFSINEHKSFMLNLMGLFFIIFSFFKVIHLPEFKASFSKYDSFAKQINVYGYVYPFIELILGAMFILAYEVKIVSIITIIVLTSTTIGIVSKLRKGQIIECACLGVVFNIPLSHVTVFENIIMIIMALTNILL